jgi:cob(I)alamin adenosyltransferase
VAAGEQAPLNPAALAYINRLSDHLFVLGRHLNRSGEGDILWKPGATR